MGSPEKISDRDSFTFVRRNDHGILSKLRRPAERGGTVLHELRRAHCRSSAAACAVRKSCTRIVQPRAAGSLTLIIRRWHDLGKSGWFTLLLLIPLLNFLVMLYLWFVRGTAGPNTYGEDPLG